MQRDDIRTSTNDPLRIAEIPLGKGRIGLTLCPGKIDEHALHTPCRRDPELDLQTVRDWGAGIVVTLMETHELELLRVIKRGEKPDFGTVVTSLGMKWWHLPVKDQHPLEDILQTGHYVTIDPWTLDCAVLRHCLHGGGRVLIHCRGGLGRTGTLAARLLIEEGMDAESAMQAVRAVRPGAIETEAQESYLRQIHQQWSEFPKRATRRKPVVAQMPPGRLMQLIRLVLEIPWAFSSVKGDRKGLIGLTEAMKACLAEPDVPVVPASDSEIACLRDMLDVLFYTYTSDAPNILRAREYFGITPLPKPEITEAVERKLTRRRKGLENLLRYHGVDRPEPRRGK